MGSIELSYGAGAKEMWKFINRFIVSRIPPPYRRTTGGYGVDVLDDGAVIRVSDRYLVIAVDSYTVKPLFFNGGNIGSLAAAGTLNDVVMMGGRPIAFMDTIVVEEGFPKDRLDVILDSMVKTLVEEGVAIIGGDFKVMPRGSIDGVVVTGAGIGIADKPIIDKNIRPGDKIIVTGPIAEHGAVILAHQLGMDKDVKGLRSDSKPLTRTVLPVIEKYSGSIHGARDPTRGGLSSTLYEWASATGLTIVIDRSKVPIRDEVRFFLDALGIDSLNMACEGVAVLAVEPGVAEDVVDDLRGLGEESAAIVGEVVEPSNDVLKGRVVAITEIGGKVFVEPRAVNLPRIC